MSDTKKCIILSSLQGNIMGEKCHSHFADIKTKIPRNLMIGSGNWGSRIWIQVCPSPGPMHLSTLPRFAPDSSLSLFLCPWGTPGGNKAHSTSSHSPSCQSLPLGTFVLLEACFLPWFSLSYSILQPVVKLAVQQHFREIHLSVSHCLLVPS